MCMYRTHHRPALRLTTMFIVVAMLFAPTASLASCCCVLAKVGQAVGLSAGGCGDHNDVASCCVSPALETAPTPQSCCIGRTGVQSVPSNCDCEQSCCDGVSIPTVAITTDNDSPRSAHNMASDSPYLFASYDFIPASSKFGIDHSFRFLSAPHRCATLCRWLN